MSWLSKFTGIHISPKKTYINKQELGGFLKKAAPVAGVLTGGLGGALLGAAGSGIGGAVRGEHIGDVLRDAAIGGVTSGIGGQLSGGGLGGGLRQAFTGGPRSFVSGLGDYGTSTGGGGGLLGGLNHSVLGKVGGFIKDNPEVIASGLGMIANRGKTAAEADLARAQAESQRADVQTQLRKEEAERRRLAAIAPLREKLMAQMAAQRPATVSANPYATA